MGSGMPATGKENPPTRLPFRGPGGPDRPGGCRDMCVLEVLGRPPYGGAPPGAEGLSRAPEARRGAGTLD